MKALMNDLISVGTVIRTRGLKGEVRVQTADGRKDRFSEGMLLYTDSGEKLHISKIRSDGLFSYLFFDEISSIEEAEKLLRKQLYVLEEDLPDPEPGFYYVKDLIGLRVMDEKNHIFGTVKDVLSYASNDIYVVVTENRKEILIPAVHDVIRKISPDEGYIRIQAMKGLLDEN